MLRIHFKFHLQAFKQGLLTGVKIQALPVKLFKFYDSILFTFFRAIGGISTLLVLANVKLNLPEYIKYLVLVLAFFHLIQMAYFSLLKSFY